METKPQLSVSIIGDSPLGVLGLKAMLAAMGVSVRAVKDRMEALSECEPGKDDAILIDMYFANETQVFLEIKKSASLQGRPVVIFSDALWTSCDGITFIHRCEHAEAMKKQLLQGIRGTQGGPPTPPHRSGSTSISKQAPISVTETFVLSEWLLGRKVTDIARFCNRSVKTISAHKRNAMRKLNVKNNRDLYWKLVKKVQA